VPARGTRLYALRAPNPRLAVSVHAGDDPFCNPIDAVKPLLHESGLDAGLGRCDRSHASPENPQSVRSWWNSGKHLLNLSLTACDPTLTWTVQDFCGAILTASRPVPTSSLPHWTRTSSGSGDTPGSASACCRASKDETARLRDGADGKEMAVLRGHRNRVNSAAFGPDGQRALRHMAPHLSAHARNSTINHLLAKTAHWLANMLRFIYRRLCGAEAYGAERC